MAMIISTLNNLACLIGGEMTKVKDEGEWKLKIEPFCLQQFGIMGRLILGCIN